MQVISDPGGALALLLLALRSVGILGLASADPAVVPVADPAHLSDPDDRVRPRGAPRLIRRILRFRR
ncbi:hypothetical protein Kisp01_70840 [Kineosporia sp. NBRC 101677]|uniref:hypothetical protein n=1 Tax=Kineosporia sp. NBRC 101677 TaxID=3032197 RepID=UPI0024A2E0C4|nr:hypothetical protein [Kineosporia sp. NBRC 101677]GLY20070.1 hypothetical protein Kisp01_70840 [Kineosporia sp. NBRC 101677]